MSYTYQTSGVCSTEIRFDLEDGLIHNVAFTGGCNGNLKAISKLVEGKKAEEIIALLRGNTCGWKSTSCADQLAIALTLALEKEKAQ